MSLSTSLSNDPIVKRRQLLVGYWYESDEHKHAEKPHMDESYIKKAIGSIYVDPMPSHLGDEHLVRSLFVENDGDKIVRMFPMFSKLPDMNLRISIAGKSGSGKSFFTGQVLRQLLKVEKRPVYLISKVVEDKNLDFIKGIVRVDIYKPIFLQMLSSDFAGSYVVFDDIDTINDDLVRKHAAKLRDDMLQTGRHDDIDIINVGHRVLGGHATRQVINECTHIVFFPHGQPQQFFNYFRNYQHFSEKDIDRHLRAYTQNYNEGRFVVWHCNNPPYLLTQKSINLI